MLKALGTNFSPDDITPNFKHPRYGCRLKLVQNTFADLNILYDKDGNAVGRQYLKELHNIQESEGLHLANKLRSSHINWHQQRMKK